MGTNASRITGSVGRATCDFELCKLRESDEFLGIESPNDNIQQTLRRGDRVLPRNVEFGEGDLWRR